MDTYSFRDFLESIENLNFHEMREAVARRRADAELANSRKKVLRVRAPAIKLAAQLAGLQAWMAMGLKANGMLDEDFALIEPLCRKLIEKKQLKPEALNLFMRRGRGG